MRSLKTNPNVDNSNPTDYPDARVKNNSGTGDGTPVNERVYGDIHQAVAKAMRMYAILPNELPDNETNGYQLLEAFSALASKNDYVIALSSVTGVLSVPVKLASLLTNESIICKSTVNLAAETQIRGSDNSVFTATIIGNFKTDEYVRLVKTASTVVLVRLVDAFNLNAAVAELNYLKAASQAEEDTGTANNVATTPLTNKTAFGKRVTGVNSTPYLAVASVGGVGGNNGLMSASDKEKVNAATKTKNIGGFSGLDVGGSSGTLTSFGDVTFATATASSNNSFITVSWQNPMPNVNYYVRIFVESSGNIQLDNDINAPVFKVLSVSQAQIAIAEVGTVVQNLKIHLEAVAY